MLKVDLHIHTKDDPHGGIKYSNKQMIDCAAKLKFDVISITNHNISTYDKKLSDYAKSKGILLIPGIEIRINGKEVLLYNFTEKQIEKIKSFEDLKRMKSKNNLIIAPHPYFVKSQCLKNYLVKHIYVFDAIEYSFFYTKTVNFNKKAEKVAKKYGKTLIGTSDMHNLWQLGYTYSMIDSKKKIKNVFDAIKKNKIELKTKPLPYKKFISSGLDAFLACSKKH